MRIRPATVDDWPQIWQFFRIIAEGGETYAYPANLTEETAVGEWFESGHTVVVAVDSNDRILGSAHFGPNRPGRGSHVATASFMVAPEAAGHGVGRALGEYVIEASRAENFHSIQFNAVVETNAAAVALWKSLGFDIIGTVPEAFDHPVRGLVGLHVMYLKL